MAVPSVDLEIEEKEEEITNADPSSDLVAPILGTQVGTTTGGLCKSKPGNWHAEMATATCVCQRRPVQHREFLISKHPNFLYRASAPPYPQSETMHIATGFLEADAPKIFLPRMGGSNWVTPVSRTKISQTQSLRLQSGRIQSQRGSSFQSARGAEPSAF